MTTPQDSAARARHDLQWAVLLDTIARHCVGDGGGARVRAIVPAQQRAAVQPRAQLVQQASASSAAGEPLPVRAVAPLDEAFERLARGGALGGEALYETARVLQAAAELRRHAGGCRTTLPQLAAAIDSAASLEPVQAAIHKAIDPSGRVLDDASPALLKATRLVHQSRAKLMQQLKRLLSRYSDVLQDSRYVERDGRYGLPVRADAHRRVNGIVLGASATGATLYVEPPECTALGNQMALAEASVERERARVLQQLSSQLHQQLDELLAAYEACLLADELAAIARFAGEQRALVLQPAEQPLLRLKSMRHPLLTAQQDIEVVPHDITLEAGQALVVSGPNAGGKTVALKSLGLAAMMVAAALPVPLAAGSLVGFFPHVFTDIGDQQSIAQSLSTFSGHIANLKTIVAQADGSSLVLLDEVAGGTDPEEGAALAVAVVEALVAAGAAVAVTTHYERLKEIAAGDERMENASVGFDFARMMPTFTLTQGIPGASSALAVARRFGLPDEVVSRAEALVGDSARRREQLLAALERERQALKEAKESAQEHALEAELAAEQAQLERERAREKERRRLAAESSALMAEVRKARQKLRDIGERGADAKSARAAERQIDAAAHLVALDGALSAAAAPQAAEAKPLREVKVGATVYVPKLKRDATVVSISGKQAQVQAGAFTVRVPLKQLRASSATATGGTAKRQPKLSKPQPRKEEKSALALRTSSNTCDLRGMRVEEALSTVDSFLDEQLRAREATSFVLHGHGTGALKTAVRQHLVGHQVVAWSRAASQREGGDAFTVVALR